jgi:small conductance mechanosensitive channel
VPQLTPSPAPADTTQVAPTEPLTLGGLIEGLRASLLDPAVWTAFLGTLLQIALIAALALVVLRVLDSVVERWKASVEDLTPLDPRRQRVYTIGNLLTSAGRYVIWPIAAIMILSEMNINVGALVATAGIAGLAFGFGAQTLVKDVIAGIFLLFDDTIHVGDLVRIGTDAGTVEEIGVRLIRVRKFDGEMLMVPAGELRIFGNKSIEFARVIVPVGLSYEQDIDTVLPVMERVAREWMESVDGDILLEDEPAVQGLMDFGDSSVTARIVVKVRPGEQFAAERDLRMMLKKEFDDLGIEIPFPRRTVYTRTEPDLPPTAIDDPKASPSAPEPEASD